MSELRDRLEALATRGTPRGADDVLRSAQQDAETGMTDNTSDPDATDMEIIDDNLPVVTMESLSRRRKRFGSWVASAGVAALVGVGALAITAMIGSGGADSPEGAVRQLAEAVNSKDALAAVDVLVPSEVRSMRASVESATKRAADLRIVNEASKPLEGVDLQVDHLALRTEPLADGYAKVVITSGEISGSTHRAQLSTLLQKAMRDGEDGASRADLASLAEDSDVPTFVVVVRQGGGWYVSPAYTALEYVREINDYPVADFGSGKEAELGAATPEAAVEDALHAWQQSDWARFLELAPPDELPLYDYRAMIAASAAETEVDFTIDHLSTTATQSGDTATVKLEAWGTTGTDRGKWQVGGSCQSFAATTQTSDGSYSNLCVSGDLSGTVPFGLLYFRSGVENTTSGPVSITVVRENGRWFVSPVTTVLNAIDSTIRSIDQRSVYELLGLAYDLPPDGTITLDQPFDVPASKSMLATHVYAFEGRAGQEIVGELLGETPPNENGISSEYASGTIYTTGGEEVGWLEFQTIPTGAESQYFYASSSALPQTGSYRLVLTGFAAADERLTLWDLENAPKALRDAVAGNSPKIGECSSSSGGVLGDALSSCGWAPLPSTATPTTIASGTPSQSGAGSGSGFATATTAPSTTIGK